MIGFDEAVALIAANTAPLASEKIALSNAHGRTLAEAVQAQVRSPPFDASAMDGYAVRDSDLKAFPADLAIVGESFAGAPCASEIGPGQCVRIFTGAQVPRGAERVVAQEMVERSGPRARVDGPLAGALHIRRAGSDFERGDVLVDAGALLGPRAIVAAAAADLAELILWKRPRVAILVTGDELAEPGSARGSPGAIPESVSLGVAAMAREWGAQVVQSIRLPDELAAMERKADAALHAADLVVVTGGASVGEKDFARAMFAPAGLELIFSQVAIRPGKPAWLGRARDALVLGLPGNPTSAMVTARLLLAPLLAGLSGRAVEAALVWRSAALAGALGQGDARETFHRARWNDGAAEILSNQESSAQKALAQAQLLVRQRANGPALGPGSMVQTLDF